MLHNLCLFFTKCHLFYNLLLLVPPPKYTYIFHKPCSNIKYPSLVGYRLILCGRFNQEGKKFIQGSVKLKTKIVQDLRFSQQCCWRLKSPGMWHYVIGWVLSISKILKVKTPWSFRKLGTTHPANTASYHTRLESYEERSRENHWCRCEGNFKMYL
jgi:hypothetical protein